MAKFDVHRLRGGAGLVVDCQSNLNNRFETRVVVPLIRRSALRQLDKRTTPIFVVNREEYVFAVQGLQTVPTSLLDERVASLADHDAAIMGAIDRLFFGV